ncbi:MAG: CoA transferase [Candidatus Marinimicrobia bacterium]|nr:CoA transferase [Candidatus Neomarinimicrobiota bacterium]
MPAQPLEEVKVLDCTQFMAGPYCSLLLADMGADVVKVERPNGGDSIRDWHGHPRNPQFCYMNRNKRSLTLNFKTPEGREILLGLIKQSDVLVENFRATTMERAGFGYETLIAHNPALIYCSISGFGYDGPYRAKGGLDLIAQAMGGIMHVTGEPDGPPTSVGVPLCDLGSGMWAVSGILAALHQRGRTGRGQRVECSLLETAVAYSSWTGAGYLADQKEPRRQGSRHRQSAPYQRFATRDGFIMIGAGSQRLWKRLCAALGKEEWLEDPRFRENGQRVKNRPELEREIDWKAYTAQGSGLTKQDRLQAFMAPFIAVMILFMAIFFSAQMLMRSIIEERGNKLVEMLLSSLSSKDLMTGKILGLGALGLTQLGFYMAIAAVVSSRSGFDMLPLGLIPVFLLFAILGYFFYAALFAAVGSMFESEQDAQQVVGPLTMLPILPLITASSIIAQPDSMFARIASYFPPVTPFIMIIRVSVTELPWWEIASTAAVLGLSAWVMMRWAGIVFRTAILMTGKRITLPEIIRWIRST